MVHVPCERSCHKEHTCAMLKPYQFWFESNAKVKDFSKVGQTSRSRPTITLIYSTFLASGH